MKKMILILLVILAMACGKQGEKDIDIRMLEAVIRGDINTVMLLLSKGADVNACDKYERTPLMLASLHGHTDIVQNLLEANANIFATAKYGGTALSFARNASHGSIEKMLLEAGAEGN